MKDNEHEEYSSRYHYEETSPPTSIVRVFIGLGIVLLFIVFVVFHWML